MKNIIDLILKAERMKHIDRRGWLSRGISDVESVADHSYLLSLLVLLILGEEDSGIDVCKCLKLAIVHDLAESEIGDIIPSDGVSTEDKQSREASAMDSFVDLSGQSQLRALWDEFEYGNSKEAALVRELDFLETLIQTYIYEHRHSLPRTVLQEFWDVAESQQFSNLSEGIYHWLLSHRFDLQ